MAQRIPHEDITYRVIGAAMRVHNELGPGLKEVMYHRALSTAMRDAGLSFEHEKQLEVDLDGDRVGLLYIDHFVEDAVVVETKVLSHLLTKEEVAQVITYLAVTGAPVGLLLNFGRPRLEYKRILPPRKFTDWHERVRRYVWTTDRVSDEHPLIRSASAV
jgi:GxxExxY protein